MRHENASSSATLYARQVLSEAAFGIGEAQLRGELDSSSETAEKAQNVGRVSRSVSTNEHVMTEAPYRAIVSHYEDCLRTHGAGARAVDWKSPADAALRYDVMLGVVRPGLEGRTLLDFGCGLGGLRQHMADTGLAALRYTGLEISEAFAEAARAANPGTEILCMDVLAPGSSLPAFDYVVMNGIFTRRHSLSVSEMDAYLRRLLPVVLASCRVGLAFNVMSKSVDWESDVLYHADPGPLLDFIGRDLTRHYTLRNDYGLHETTLYLYREPVARHAVGANGKTGQGR